jgi:glycosyltransferase involved in cell wall biosynthesis
MRLVYLSPVPWASFEQRSHKFVRWFHSRSAGDVLWVEPYPTRLLMLQDIIRIKIWENVDTIRAGKGVNPSWLTVHRPRALPIEPLPGIGMLNGLFWKGLFRTIDRFVKNDEFLLGIGKPTELSLQLLDRYPAADSFFDAMDDFPAFYKGISKTAMARREQEVANQVSKILVSSKMLANRFVTYRSKLTLMRNACDVDTLPSIDAATKSPDRPVIGYVGTIGHWFDWHLVIALAKANPCISIRLIGPKYTLPPKPLPDNIELLPACNHSDAMSAMQNFTIGLIPFKCNQLTASVDPIKYYEYRALGLPILSTTFGEMALRDAEDGVFHLNERIDVVKKVAQAMAYTFNIKKTQEFRKANSWNARFNESDIFNYR